MGAIFNDELKRLRGHFMEMGIDASEQIYQATRRLQRAIQYWQSKS